jgi:hypothetical protein
MCKAFKRVGKEQNKMQPQSPITQQSYNETQAKPLCQVEAVKPSFKICGILHRMEIIAFQSNHE